MTNLYPVRTNVGSTLGEVWKWGISTIEGEAMSTVRLARSIGMEVQNLKMSLSIYGAIAYLEATSGNEVLTFSSEENAQKAIRMLEVKIDMDGIEPPAEVPSESTPVSSGWPEDEGIILRIELFFSQEDLEYIAEEYDIEDDGLETEQLKDVNNPTTQDVWMEYLENINIDTFDRGTPYRLASEENNERFKLVVLAKLS